MGVNFLFPWITQRYPNILKPYQNESFPNVDHMYMDINGIIHYFAKNENSKFKTLIQGRKLEQIYINIANYISKLIQRVRPKKSVLVAIDGVCPLAKVPNSIDRRYCAVKEEEDILEFFTQHLKKIPAENEYKTNSISVGSELLQQINKQLEFMLLKKLETEEEFKNLKVYFSNSNVPGEGEHKIFNLMRTRVLNGEITMDETHCVYGNDSDLILLSLIQQNKNIMILREVLEEDSMINVATNRIEDNLEYEIIYISLLREYLELEYKSFLGENFELTQLVNDFVMICNLIGNDFIPQIYCMNTRGGKLDQILDILKKFYKTNSAYLTNKTKIDYQIFSKFFKELLPLEIQMIKTTESEFNLAIEQFQKQEAYQSYLKEIQTVEDQIHDKELIKKQKQRKKQQEKKKQKFAMLFDENEEQQEEEPQQEIKPVIDNEIFVQHFREKFETLNDAQKKINYMSCIQGNTKLYRENYYSTYFKINQEQLEEEVTKIVENYLQGYMFVQLYYHIGYSSWDWYYRYHMPPLMIDILKGLESGGPQLKQFPPSEPLKPLEQLALIIPSKSFHLLPQCIADQINIKNGVYALHYIQEYKLFPYDLIQEYRWKILFDQMDYTEIIKSLKSLNWEKMNTVEKERNQVNANKLYYHDPQSSLNKKSEFKSFSDVQNALIKLEQFDFQFEDEETYCQRSYQEQSKSHSLPTFSLFKHLKLLEDRSKRRFKYNIYITKKTVKKYFDSFEKKRLQLAEKFDDKETYFIYHNFMTPKTMKLCKITFIGKSDPNYIPVIQNLIKYFESLNLSFESKDVFTGLKSIPLLKVKAIEYTQLYLQNKIPKVNIYTKPKTSFTGSFMEFTWKPSYPLSKTLLKAIKPSHFKNTLLIDVQTGNLFKSNEQFSIKNPQQNLTVLKQTKIIEQQKTSGQEYKQLDDSFLKQYGLSWENRQTVLLLLQNVEFITNKKEHDSLFLGQSYQIGLNLISILGKRPEEWKCVKEMIQIDGSEEQMNAVPQVSFLISKQGADLLGKYFDKIKDIIEFLKKEENKGNLIETSPSGVEYINSIFSIEELYPFLQTHDSNQKLFQFYYEISQMNKLQLPLLHTDSLFYDSAQVDQLYTGLIKSTKKTDSKIESVFQLVKMSSQEMILYPPHISSHDIGEYYDLGDQVIIMNSQNPQYCQGSVGTIIALDEENVTILLNEPQFGATNLQGYCKDYFGAIVNRNEIIKMKK